MKIILVGPGIISIPPIGSGAVEIIIHNIKYVLENLGHEVYIINTPYKEKIIQKIKDYNPDFVHIAYDDHVDIIPHIKNYPHALTTHYPYINNPYRYTDGYWNISKEIIRTQPYIFCLSEELKRTYIEIYNIPKHKIVVVPNGILLEYFQYHKKQKYPEKSICLGCICDRKRQYLLQDIDHVFFAGNKDKKNCSLYKKSKNYLGEWSKKYIYENLSHYGNLVLLSGGETAAPLVVLEALACGLGIVVSEYAKDNLDINKPFISVIPEKQIRDKKYVENVIVQNRYYAVQHREEILEYIKKFSWYNIIKYNYIPGIKYILSAFQSRF